MVKSETFSLISEFRICSFLCRIEITPKFVTPNSTETLEGSACYGKGRGSIVWKEKVEEIDQFNLFQQVHAFQLKPFVRAHYYPFHFQHDKMTSSSSSMSSGSTFRKLTETELERQPEEVFDLVEEIGKEGY